jgi:hypothetical protein
MAGDGREIFYIAADRGLTAAEVTLKIDTLETGKTGPVSGPLLSINSGYQYDVYPDGKRFLAIIPTDETTTQPLTLVQNWMAGLKK